MNNIAEKLSGTYIADLHIHSHYAGATSKFLCLETMYQWALIKGIDVVATGDFTHPGWFKELKEKLQTAGNGFYTLKNIPSVTVLDDVKPQHKTIFFCLSTEVSCEYKIDGIQYKNHHLIYAKDFETAEQLNHKLSKFGDLVKDGRPTLNMTAHQLFEMILSFSPNAYFVPAHIWTPWFSTLGSKNGHVSLQDCFKDLTSELFAVETSLSADPLMCKRYSALDNLTLMSNSDAHSAHKLGREVNRINAELSYDGMFNSIITKNGFLGTYEYYQQLGKYFNDGHRNCNISIDPETYSNGICPVCKMPLTIGVARRVEQLADRSESLAAAKFQPFEYTLPLNEIYAEILDCSDVNGKVNKAYSKAISVFGNEFNVLHHVELSDLKKFDRKLSFAIEKLRNDEKYFVAGYDGIAGRISFFNEDEKHRMNNSQLSMF